MKVFLEDGEVLVPPEESWFENGFWRTIERATLRIEEGREPSSNAEGNLASLAFCFVAPESAN